MRDGSIDDRYDDDVLLRVVNPLGNRIGDFVRLSEADADMPLAVADDNDCIETEPPSPLDNLGHAVDVDEPVFQLQFTRFDTCQRVSSFLVVLKVDQISVSLSGEDSNLYSRLQRPRSCH